MVDMLDVVVVEKRSQGERLPDEFIARIVEELHPLELWLYGSRARGDAREDSDWDVLAVLPDDAPPSDFDVADVWRRLRDLRLRRLELVPVEKTEFDVYRNVKGTLSNIAAVEGVRVYAR